MSDITERDLMILAATLYGEADPWNRRDAEMIAAVILNRTAYDDAWWGKDIETVCFSRRQFSCWDAWVGEAAKYALDSRERLRPLLIDGNRARPNPSAFRSGWAAICLEVATIETAAFRDGRRSDPASGADHYVASYVKTLPDWAMGASVVAVSEFRNGKDRHNFYSLGPQSAGAVAPKRSPIPQSKPAQGAILTGGGLSVGAVLDWLVNNGAKAREAVSGLFSGGTVPAAALWLVVAIWAASMLWLWWLRREETRGWISQLPYERSPPPTEEEKAEASKAAIPAPEAERVARLEAMVAKLLAEREPDPPKSAPRRASRPRKSS